MSDKDIDLGMNHGPDTDDHDKTYENEQSMVTIPLRDYDRLKDQEKYIGKPRICDFSWILDGFCSIFVGKYIIE